MIRHFSFKVLPSLVTLLAFFIMCKLGFWQLDRAEQKQLELQAFSQLEVLEQQGLLRIGKQDVERLHGRKVTLSGALDNKTIWLVDNKTYMGKVGYSLVVKMNLATAQRDFSDNKMNENSSVLIDLGWVAGGKYRDKLPSIKLPLQLDLQAIIKAKDFSQIVLKDTSESQKRLSLDDTQIIRVQSYQQIFQSNSFDSMPMVAYAESNTLPNTPQLYEPVVMPPEKHVAYAVQWFLLALASLVVYGFASYQKPNVLQNSSNIE